jgi:hypothetical protein
MRSLLWPATASHTGSPSLRTPFVYTRFLVTLTGNTLRADLTGANFPKLGIWDTSHVSSPLESQI